MPTRSDYMVMLRKADAANDTQSAQAIVRLMNALPPDGQPPAGQPPAQAPAAPSLVTPVPAQKKSAAQVAAESTVNDMNFGQTLMAGAGQGFNEMDQSGRQLSSYLSGNKALADQVAQEQSTNAEADAALSHTWGGRIGNIGANALVSMLPVGGLEAGASRLAASGIAPRIAALLGKGAVQGGLTGAFQGGYLQPTTAGGSRVTNALIGGGVGAAIPGAISAAPYVAKAVVPTLMAAGAISHPGIFLAAQIAKNWMNRGASAAAPAAADVADTAAQAAAQPAAQAATQAAAPLTKAQIAKAAKASTDAIGSQMGAITNNLSVPIGDDVAAKAAAIRDGFGEGLSDNADNALSRLQYATQMPGKVLGLMRSSALMAANKAAKTDPEMAQGYYSIQRLADEQIDNHLSSLDPTPDELSEGISTSDKLRQLRASYALASKGIPVDPAEAYTTPAREAAKQAAQDAADKATAQAAQDAADQQAAQAAQQQAAVKQAAIRAASLRNLQTSGVAGLGSQAVTPGPPKPLNVNITGGTTYPAGQPPPQ